MDLQVPLISTLELSAGAILFSGDCRGRKGGAGGGHGVELLQLGLDGLPLLRVLFGRDGRRWVGVEVFDVLAQRRRKGLAGLLRKHTEEAGIGLVAEAVGAGLDLGSGIQVEVGYQRVDGAEVRKEVPERFSGVVDAIDIFFLRLGVGATNGGIGERPDARQDEENSSQQMGSDAWLFAVLVPAVLEFGLSEVFIELREGKTGRFRREAVFVQEHLGIGDAGKEAANGEAVSAKQRATMADDIVKIDAVGLKESTAQQRDRYRETNVIKIGRGREATLADLVDIKGKLRANVGMLAFAVGNDRAILFAELGELRGDGFVDGLGMADRVPDVMGERADGECQLVGGVGVANKAEDEIAGADVVGQVAKKVIAEWIVPEVLNGAAAIGEGVRLLNLYGSEFGIAFEQKRPDGLLPGQIDELFVRLHGIRQAVD